MEQKKKQEKNILKYRAFRFSLDIIDFIQTLPKGYVWEIIGKQLLRSATSIGANIIEAQGGRTRKDFTNYYQIAYKSAQETKYWLVILREKLAKKGNGVDRLLSNAVELSKILSASLLTLKERKE